MLTTSETLALAIGYHKTGRLQDAEELDRQISQAEPNHAYAVHLLGLLTHQMDQNEIAVELLGRAIALNANEAAFHYNLGEAYRAMARLSEAVACYHRALELNLRQQIQHRETNET